MLRNVSITFHLIFSSFLQEKNLEDSPTRRQRRAGMRVIPGYNIFQVFDAGVFEALNEFFDFVAKLAICREKKLVKY